MKLVCASLLNHTNTERPQRRGVSQGELAATDDLCLSMLHCLLAFLRRPRATDRLRHYRAQLDHYRAQLDRLQTELEVVKDGLLRGDISIEDLGQG
jgi:hypothetical protein